MVYKLSNWCYLKIKTGSLVCVTCDCQSNRNAVTSGIKKCFGPTTLPEQIIDQHVDLIDSNEKLPKTLLVVFQIAIYQK